MEVEKIRQDFPVLSKGVTYLDSACMSLKPVQVVEAMNDYYNNFPACGGRSVHRMSRQVEDARANARKEVQKLIGAKKSGEIVFTRNTTEGLNLVTRSLDLKKGAIILTSDREHNSNLIPAQMMEKEGRSQHRVILSDNDFCFDLQAFEDMMVPEVELVSVVYTSNLDGYTLPVKDIIKIAHDNGSLVMLDAAQSVPHHEVNCRKLGVDFLAFSGHKMLGPTGTGALYVKGENYDKLSPFMVGGETVEWSTYEDHAFLKPPERFEAGLQNYAGEIGLGAAAEYLKKIGYSGIEKNELKLTTKLHDGLAELGAEIVGVQNPVLRGGVTSFNLPGIGYHDAAMILDSNYNIAVRSGQHCVHSWFQAQGIEGSVRASLYLYNTEEEIEKLLGALSEIVKLG